jgi:hypothetical protein
MHQVCTTRLRDRRSGVRNLESEDGNARYGSRADALRCDHGRIETRTIQLMDAPGDLPFPHVSQAYLIERHVTALDGTPLSDVAALGVTSLDATRASPAALAGLVRGQRTIESLHWLRDTLYREDQSQVRTRSGPRAMAALRNLAIGALHLAGRHDTTEATRSASRYMDRPFTILGLTS